MRPCGPPTAPLQWEASLRAHLHVNSVQCSVLLERWYLPYVTFPACSVYILVLPLSNDGRCMHVCVSCKMVMPLSNGDCWMHVIACLACGVLSDSFRHMQCRQTDDEYLLSAEPVRSRNERHLAAAQHQHALAMQQWQRDYDLALMEWSSRQVDTHVCCQIYADSWFHAYIVPQQEQCNLGRCRTFSV